MDNIIRIVKQEAVNNNVSEFVSISGGKTMKSVAVHKDGDSTICIIVSGNTIVSATGADARSAYRAAWRELRLARYDASELCWQIDMLYEWFLGVPRGKSRRVLELALRLAGASAARWRENRIARHAAAIRAHREALRRLQERYEAALQEQQQQFENSFWFARKLILERTKEKNRAASQIMRLQALITQARAQSSELDRAMGDLATDDLEQAIERLLELATAAAAQQ